MDPMERGWYHKSASRITGFAHFFGILSIIFILVWLLHYRGGLHLDSDNPYAILNVHIFLMFFGFIFFAGQAMMIYRTVAADHGAQKFIHMAVHVIALALGITGIYATFKFHHRRELTNMYTLHSWMGLGTFLLYGLQVCFELSPLPEQEKLEMKTVLMSTTPTPSYSPALYAEDEKKSPNPVTRLTK